MAWGGAETPAPAQQQPPDFHFRGSDSQAPAVFKWGHRGSVENDPLEHLFSKCGPQTNITPSPENLLGKPSAQPRTVESEGPGMEPQSSAF